MVKHITCTRIYVQAHDITHTRKYMTTQSYMKQVIHGHEDITL